MKIIFFIVITIIIFLSWFFLNNKSPNDSFDASENIFISEDEASSKIVDLTSLSQRISKKNIYLDLEQINENKYFSQAKNLLVFKKLLTLKNLLWT